MGFREDQPQAVQQSSEQSSEKNTQLTLAWLTLGLLRGMHSRLFNALLDKLGSPGAILQSDQGALENLGVDSGMARSISLAGKGDMNKNQQALLQTSLAWLEGNNNFLITRDSPDYPDLLAEIPDSPPLLYVKGSPAVLHQPQLAIVGSRYPTAGGKRNARSFARQLSGSGFAITSGLAMGIDVESHVGAMQARGSTIAVLGTGIDRVYPARHQAIFEQIAEQGALVSEFSPGVPPLPANFPRRNRIISGLSLGVLVVEASVKSGSMITAKLALEQGREVFAIPGSIHNPVARGCHRLISNGAKLVQTAADIVEECGGLLAGLSESTSGNQEVSGSQLTVETKTVLQAIGYDVTSIDEIVVETGLEPHQVNVALVNLELLGFICREKTGFVLAAA